MYTPQVNDYVTWKNDISGWIYFKGSKYLTIEISICPKDQDDYEISPLHINKPALILCYRQKWNELTYVKSRNSIYEE